MDSAAVADALRETMAVVVKLGGPPLLAALAVGLLVSVVQAVTQVSESTLSFVPKVALVTGVLVMLGSFMLTTLTDYTHGMMDRLVAVGSE